jgi:hypothetical protein
MKHALLAFSLLVSSSTAQVSLYQGDEAGFVALTGAVSAGPFPDVGVIPGGAGATFAHPPLTISLAPPATALIVGGSTQWTTVYPDPVIAISDKENLNVDFDSPVYVAGFYFVEHSTPGIPGCGGGGLTCISSTFEATLKLGGVIVGTAQYDAPDDAAIVIGLHSPQPFDRLELREILGDIDNEYWGTFFTSTCPAISTSSLEVKRLGSPPNPDALLPGLTSGPVTGAVWDPVIDHTTFFPTAVLDILGVTLHPLNLPIPPFGTLLCNPAVVLASPTVAAGVPFHVPVPADCQLIGVPFCGQGASLDSLGKVLLTNALDATIGTF